MTIITKPITEKKDAKKGLQRPLVVTSSRSGSAELGEANGGSRVDLSNSDMELWLSPSVRRRISASTTVCVFITALLVMSICIIGGVYLYRQITLHQRMSRFRGWCGIPFERNNLKFGRKDYLLGPNKPFFKENDAEVIGSDQFRQDFDLDLESDLYESIDVPDFGIARAGRFIHDFESNKTGLIDQIARRCFVMPLDREHIKPPRSMFDLVQKMWSGEYNVNLQLIERKMRVVEPPIEDLNAEGSFIANKCAGFKTYRLVERKEEPQVMAKRERRSAAVKEEIGDEKALNYLEFGGSGIIRYEIY